MLAAIVCLLVVLVIVAIGRLVLAVSESVRERPAIDEYIGHQVVLHLRTGTSLRGTLTAVAPDALILANAQHVGQTVHPLDGRQVVQRANVDFFQLLFAAPSRAGDRA